MGMQESERRLRPYLSRLAALWRGGAGGGMLTGKELSRAASSLLTLQRGLTGERTLAGAGYMQDQTLLGAYLLYYWPVSYLEVSVALAPCRSRLEHSAAKGTFSVLDLGCGPGAASAALLDLLPKKTAVSVDLVDASGKAMKQATALLGREHVEVRTFRADLEKEETWRPLLAGPYDCILCNHTLNELWKGRGDAVALRTAWVDHAGGLLAPDGMLFLGEPALLATSRDLLAVRDGLMERGWHLASPCLCDGPCPALRAGSQHTCHAEVAWRPGEPMASLARLAALDRTSVKMTYVAVSKAPVAREAVRAYGDLHGLVVSEPMRNKAGRVRFLLCDGVRRVPVSADCRDRKAERDGFFDLKRYDEVVVSRPEKRENGWGYGPESSLRVLGGLEP